MQSHYTTATMRSVEAGGVEPPSAAYQAAALIRCATPPYEVWGSNLPGRCVGPVPSHWTNLVRVPQLRIERRPPALQTGAQTDYATGAFGRWWSPPPLHVDYSVFTELWRSRAPLAFGDEESNLNDLLQRQVACQLAIPDQR